MSFMWPQEVNMKLTEIKTDHEAMVKTWACNECENIFEYAGVPSFCPECGRMVTEVECTV
jgi:rubrerythrin